jgi:hypothetical protein
MTLLHVRLYGGRTQITLPPSFRGGALTLRGYRVLFNRDNHGYYHLALRAIGLIDSPNVISYTTRNQGERFTVELPIWLDPEAKLTHDTQITWPMGRVQNGNALVTFEIALYNCIERKRYDQAVFDTSIQDVNITGLKGLNPKQTYFGEFGQSVPLYVIPKSYFPDQHTDGIIEDTFDDVYRYRSDGTPYVDENGDKVIGSFPSTRWVHTGVQVGNVDPTPGGADYSTDRMTAQEELEYKNSDGAITGSGYRTNAVIYPYTIELVFEVTQ